jgi:hypothetical protein
MGYKFYNPGGQLWLPSMVGLAADQIATAYENGFVGAYFDPDEWDRRRGEALAATGYATVGDAATANGWAGSAAGQLVIPFVHVLEQYPGCWPGPAQERGDCVSHSDKNTCLLTTVCDVVSGLPDPRTGNLEGFPEISAEGIRQGCISSEWVYWFRGSNGDGWSCDASASWRTKIGIMLRQAYPELGIDLTRYSGSLAGKYGGQKPPEAMQVVGREHVLWSTANADTFEESRDALANGHGLHTCGGEGISSTRDENGVSRRSGSWSHAMSWIGADDRPETHKLYGEGLVLDLNSWAKWNNGPRDIRDSARYVPAEKRDAWVAAGIVNHATGNIMIPDGSAWIRYSEFKNRQVIAFSGVQGWKPKKCNPLQTVFG